MIERKLNKLLEEAKEIRKYLNEKEKSGYDKDVFRNLSDFISKELNSSFFKDKNAKVIANHFDEILPFIVGSNIDILLKNIKLLVKQPNFKEKFIEGLKNYPYKDEINKILNNIRVGLNSEANKYDEFLDYKVLSTLASMDLDKASCIEILNRLSKERQKEFLILLLENNRDIYYSAIEYKGNNKQLVYGNITHFIESSQNLYALMKFVKDDARALSEVKDYIDNNEEKATESILNEINRHLKVENPTLREIIKLMILDVAKNENAKLSDITFNGGGYSLVILIGNKVIKLGERVSKKFPNNPYIIAPLLRKDFQFDNEHCFVEVTERVDTNIDVSEEELYQLFKKLRDLNLVWTDIKIANVGRLTKENIIHWRDNIEPSEEVLGLDSKRGEIVLKEGDLVVLDADLIYDENDPNIKYSDNNFLYEEFEKRYQQEKKGLKEQETDFIFDDDETNIYEENENKGFHK